MMQLSGHFTEEKEWTGLRRGSVSSVSRVSYEHVVEGKFIPLSHISQCQTQAGQNLEG